MRCKFGIKQSIVVAMMLSGLATSARAAESITTASGPERLVMPYSCTIESGDVVLKPGPERPFPIVEARQERPFTTCNPPFSNNCRTMTLHKFDVACGGVRVPWVRVAAATRRSKAGRVWLEKGHINMTRKADAPTGSARSCSDKGTQVASATSGECLPWRVSREIERMVLPEGFAPAAELGARFIAGAEPGTPEGTAITLAKADATIVPLPAAARPHDFTIVREPLPDVTAAISAGPPLDLEDNWITVVEARDLSDAAAPSALSRAMTFASWLAGLTALSALGWFGWQRQSMIPAVAWPQFTSQVTSQAAFDWLQKNAADLIGRVTGRFHHNESTGASYDPLLANAAENVALMLQQAERTVINLTTSAPLRDVLEQELASIRQRLSAAKASALDGNGSVVKLVAQFRSLNRELDRVQRIAESASQSPTGVRATTTMPKTKSEAYEVLGVNSDVSDNILKRLVDALRLTWHPDYAKDEPDRLVREDRIKQINIAWDLINDKRRAA